MLLSRRPISPNSIVRLRSRLAFGKMAKERAAGNLGLFFADVTTRKIRIGDVCNGDERVITSAVEYVGTIIEYGGSEIRWY